VAAAEPGGELHDPGAVVGEAHLRVRRAVLDPERLGGRAGGCDCFRDVVGARPGVRERNSERGRLGGETVGDGKWIKGAVDGKGVDRNLGTLDELLHESAASPRFGHGELDRRLELGGVADQREPLLTLAVGRLDDAGERETFCLRRELPARLGHPRLVEALALALLGNRQRGRLRRERMRKPETVRDTRRDGDGPIDPGRDDTVHTLGLRELSDRGLVLGRDDRASVGVLEPWRLGIAVAGDHEEPALACRAQKPELCRAGP
jgi:hypothetical protein